MKIEDTLKKKLQGIDNGRVRGRLKGNFGYMRSDEIARVQEMKKRTKNSLGHFLDDRQPRRGSLSVNKKIFEQNSGIFQVQISNRIPKRESDPEVVIGKMKLKVMRTEQTPKKMAEVELDFDSTDIQQNVSNEQSPQESGSSVVLDVLVV